MVELKKRFGKLVAAHRRRRGLTQEALAAAAELSPDMIARMEAGATGARFTTITKLAAALQVDPGELFSTEVPAGALERQELTEITTRLATLNDRELRWLSGVIDAALRKR